MYNVNYQHNSQNRLDIDYSYIQKLALVASFTDLEIAILLTL
jgi:hypothetical protein